MNKLKLFIENFLVYGLGGIISKVIPLIMVPIVTRIMPTTDYYGISDMSNTVVQFGSAIAIMAGPTHEELVYGTNLTDDF